jgi:hypothetical protein
MIAVLRHRRSPSNSLAPRWCVNSAAVAGRSADLRHAMPDQAADFRANGLKNMTLYQAAKQSA